MTLTRLIPAHAGKTSSSARPDLKLRAHPRSRGENPPPVRSRASWAGSSPLTRGKPPASDPYLTTCGLIPAHAGKTPTATLNKTGSRAHPRSRGENAHGCEDQEGVSGSSPLTRGKQRRRYQEPVHWGLIPAHAGKTGSGGRRPWDRGAHPRSRGENGAEGLRDHLCGGSSPLTRGKPVRRSHRQP